MKSNAVFKISQTNKFIPSTILLLLISCGFLINISAQQLSHSKLSSVDETKVAKFISTINQKMPEWLNSYRVPGVQVILLNKWQIAYSGNFGWADKKANIKVTSTTIFPVASVSKSLAAIGVIKLADKGRINLDSPFVKYVHRWKLPKSRYGETSITIRQLITHTAGVNGRSANYFSKKTEVPTTIDELTKGKNGIGAIVNTAVPGTKWSYSAGGYLMLQLLIEEITGKTYDAYMKEEIFTPLNMKNSRFMPAPINNTKLYDFNLKSTPDNYFDLF